VNSGVSASRIEDDPRYTVIPNFPCTLPDGTPGVSVAVPTASQVGAGSLRCIAPSAVVIATHVPLTGRQIADAVPWPRQLVDLEPSSAGALVGVAYGASLVGADTVAVDVTIAGATVTGTGWVTGYRVSTDTGGDYDGVISFRSTEPGSPRRPAGTLFWQTAGIKNINISTSWSARVTVVYPDGFVDTFDLNSVTVRDVTTYPLFGLTTRITSTE
jgi:hypothetical protein